MESRYDYGGDEYIFVGFDIEMSLEVNFKVLSVCQEIERQQIPGVIEVIPAITSYLIHFEPEEIHPQKLIQYLRDLEHKAEHIKSLNSRLVDIPVLYDDPWTRECAKRFSDRHQDASVTNLEYLMRINGFTSKEEFIAAHSGIPYWIVAIGFVPGTAPGFQMVRRERSMQAPKYIRPRTDTPERAVSHGGVFMAIYPVRGPGGYQLMGMTPVPIYDPTGSLVDLRGAGKHFLHGKLPRRTLDHLLPFRQVEIHESLSPREWRHVRLRGSVQPPGPQSWGFQRKEN
jgi:urea carboxylase